MLEYLRQLVTARIINDLDFHFARLIAEIEGEESAELLLAAALVSQAVGQGDVCLALDGKAGGSLFSPAAVPQIAPHRLPSLKVWLKKLQACSVVGAPGDAAPLILDQRQRLYLGRFWQLEADLARMLMQRASRALTPVEPALLKGGLDRLFPIDAAAPDWQRVAAVISALRNLSVISGGPGTGKTRTITRILALLLEQPGGSSWRVALAAPTGKAAARLTEAVTEAKKAMPASDAVIAMIPSAATTIHRLLGSFPGSAEFRHNPENLLHLDLLVVDEASMVDLSLMCRLLEALPAECKLILLGDKDQLSAVEAGNVLGDICAGPLEQYSADLQSWLHSTCALSQQGEFAAVSPIQDSLVQLQRSYRFDATSPIGRLAKAVNRGDANTAWGILQDRQNLSSVSVAASDQALAGKVLEGLSPVYRMERPADHLAELARFQVLCALREGPRGVIRTNQQIERLLQSHGMIQAQARWYAGRRLMILRNDYRLNLFNGDSGIVFPDEKFDGKLRAWFRLGDGALRRLPPAQLPYHETAFAMTVHKSQGSEFDQVVLVLPDEDAPVLCRELIYTAVTRAKQGFHLISKESVFRAALSRGSNRTSGLRDALWMSA